MAIVPPVIVVMEKACRNAAKSLIRDFGELEKLQISKKDKNDFVSSADIRASETISFTLGKDRPDFLQIDEETFKIEDLDMNNPKDREKYAKWRKGKNSQPRVINS